MKIANKISLSFLTVAILLCGTAAPVSYFTSRYNLLKLIDSRLEALVVSKKQHTETYLELIRASINQLSRSVVLENFLKANN